MAKRNHGEVVVAAVLSVADGEDSIVRRDGDAVVDSAAKGNKLFSDRSYK